MGMLKAIHKSCSEPLIFEYQYFVAETIKHTRLRFFCCCGGIFAIIGFYPAFQRMIKFFYQHEPRKNFIETFVKKLREVTNFLKKLKEEITGNHALNISA